MNKAIQTQPNDSAARKIGRWVLGGAMVIAGIAHLTFARRPYRAQVPKFVPKLLPLSVDEVVVWSGVAEITMGSAFALLPRQRKLAGSTLAAFYLAVLPGNIAQWRHGRRAFGLHTDAKRFWRLFLQPIPMLWALWSSGVLDKSCSPAEGLKAKR